MTLWIAGQGHLNCVHLGTQSPQSGPSAGSGQDLDIHLSLRHTALSGSSGWDKEVLGNSLLTGQL